MPKMLAVANTYYKQARIREGDVFEVDTEEHVRFFENRGEARQLPLTEEAIAAGVVEPMDTENTSPIMKRPRGRPPKNKVMEPSSGDTYNTK